MKNNKKIFYLDIKATDRELFEYVSTPSCKPDLCRDAIISFFESGNSKVTIPFDYTAKLPFDSKEYKAIIRGDKKDKRYKKRLRFVFDCEQHQKVISKIEKIDKRCRHSLFKSIILCSLETLPRRLYFYNTQLTEEEKKVYNNNGSKLVSNNQTNPNTKNDEMVKVVEAKPTLSDEEISRIKAEKNFNQKYAHLI